MLLYSKLETLGHLVAPLLRLERHNLGPSDPLDAASNYYLDHFPSQGHMHCQAHT